MPETDGFFWWTLALTVYVSSLGVHIDPEWILELIRGRDRE